MFKDIANVLIIVILLAVIFSQLTGYGIDNYGIKKLLPKLILMAVLLNLSFVICQLAVDLSNIAGAGLDNLFKSIGGNIYPGYTAGEFVTALVAALFGALAGGGAIAGTAITILAIGSGSGVMLAVMLVLSLLVALAAVIMFIVMIGIRQIVVVVLIAISPLAFVCYIMPNTRGLFNKWWSLFKAMLIVYPICGAVHGLSYIIRGIAFGGGGSVLTPVAIVAVIASFLPFFMLPGLLRSSMTALGKMGGALMVAGGAMRRGVKGWQGAAQNSEAYKAAMEKGRRNMNLRKTGFEYDRKTGQIRLDADGNPIARKQSAIGKFLAGGDVGASRARAQALRDIEQQRREDEMMRGTGFASALAGMYGRADAQRVSEYEAMLGDGKERIKSTGERVNIGDVTTMEKYHKQALDDYARATDEDGRKEAMAKIRAAQNIMAKTDKGRAALQRNFADSLSRGQVDGLSDAAAHIMTNYGDKFKAVNRGAHAMFQDLQSTDLTSSSNVSTLQAKLNATSAAAYDYYGIDKYTAESLANADDAAIDNMVRGISSGVITGSDLDTIRATAFEALQKQRNGTLNIKPEVAKKLQDDILGSGYVPPMPKTDSSEFYVRHEEDAMRMGKTTITVPPSILTSAPASSFEGYAVPKDFAGSASTPRMGSDGHWYYDDVASKKAWDASTGRFVNLP